MSDAAQYTFLAVAGGFFGWYAGDLARWIIAKCKRPGVDNANEYSKEIK